MSLDISDISINPRTLALDVFHSAPGSALFQNGGCSSDGLFAFKDTVSISDKLLLKHAMDYNLRGKDFRITPYISYEYRS